MIHVLTVHWQTDRWVDIQLTYLRKHIQEPFRVYAFLNGVPQEHRAKYFYSSTEPITRHAIKLNLLADIATICASDPADVLIFLDGDAFPVGDIVSFGREKLGRYPLVAVQRLENAGDVQPHPCFCLTTVGFWKAVDGDWKEGHEWVNSQGRAVTDVGGNLLGILRGRNVDWYPMLRSNRRNLHPVFFGLYEDLVYHHGAAFRVPSSRLDRIRARKAMLGEARGRLHQLLERIAPAGRLSTLKELVDPGRKNIRENQVLMQQVYQAVLHDPYFYRYFQQPEDHDASGILTMGSSSNLPV